MLTISSGKGSVILNNSKKRLQIVAAALADNCCDIMELRIFTHAFCIWLILSPQVFDLKKDQQDTLALGCTIRNLIGLANPF
jgi:hypothetical protein